jgi:O-antigen ligase
MMRILETIWLVCFLLGLLLLGVFGTWAETAPFWYGAGLVAVSGVGALLSRQGKPEEKMSPGCLILMGVLGSYLAWRGLTSEVKWLARQDLVFAATAVVTYGLMAVRYTAPRARLAVLGVLFLLVAGNAGLGLYQYFVKPTLSIFSLFGLRRSGEISAGGFFESGNHMAGFMTLAGLPLLGVAMLGQGLRGTVRAFATLGFLLAATGVAFSTSRGGAAGFFCGMGLVMILAFFLWLTQRRSAQRSSRLGWWLASAAVSFPVILAVVGMNLRHFFNKGGDLTSLASRFPLWDAAMAQWQLSPLVGTGARSYEYMERAFRTTETKWMVWAGEVDAIFAHNDYLQCLADYGLIGLGLVLLVVLVHFGRALFALHRDAISIPPLNPEGSGLASGLVCGAMAGIAGIMVQAIAEFNLHIGINAVMAGVLLGILATPGFKVQPDNPTKSPEPTVRPKAGAGLSGPRLAAAGVIASISVLLLNAAWRIAPGDLAWRQAKKLASIAATLPEVIEVSGLYQKATSLDPDNAKAWHQRGMASLAIGQMTNKKYAAPFYEESLRQLERSLELYPKNPYAAAQAGKVAGYLKKPAQAEAYFKTALTYGANIQSVNESYGDYLMLGQKYEKAVGYLVIAKTLGDPESAHRAFEKLERCLQRLKEQGIAAPPEAFFSPGKP